jgi:2-desacetyl-2-hydroxyethyl bacteriochlorophyllide A dehydrogenase
MKQLVLKKPGDFILHDVSDAVPNPGEALVRVRKIGVCGTDIHAFHGRQPFFEYPRVLGHELGVEVVSVPDDNCGVSVGDICSVEPYMNCGTCIACRAGRTNCCERLEVFGVHIDGGHQELLAVPPHKLHPANDLEIDQLALVETLGIGAHGVERADIQQGEFVLVIGAGPIGLSAMPFVQARGGRLAVMDINEQRLAFCREQMGVEMTLDALDPDLTGRLMELGGGDLPTAILDATGNSKSMEGCFDLAAPGGRIVFIGLFPGRVSFDDPNFHRRELSVHASRNAVSSTFTDIIALIRSGKIDTTPWVTHRMAFDEVPETFADTTAAPGIIKAIIDVD